MTHDRLISIHDAQHWRAAHNNQETEKDCLADEIRDITLDRGDVAPHAKAVIARVNGFDQDMQPVSNPLGFHEAIVIYSSAISEDPPETDEPNEVLYSPYVVIESLFNAFRRVDLDASEDVVRPAIYELVLFLLKYGQQQYKWGIPVTSRFDSFNETVNGIKSELLQLTSGSGEHATVFQTALKRVLFPLYDESVFRLYELMHWADEAKSERDSVGDGKLYQYVEDIPNLDSKRKEVDIEIGFHFQGHGIDSHVSHGDHQYFSDLRSLLFLLKFGLDPDMPPLHSINLTPYDGGAALGASHPYTEGGFIVLGGYKKTIDDGIEAVLVNPHFYHVIDELSTQFPNITFIRADELPDKLYELVPADDR